MGICKEVQMGIHVNPEIEMDIACKMTQNNGHQCERWGAVWAPMGISAWWTQRDGMHNFCKEAEMGVSVRTKTAVMEMGITGIWARKDCSKWKSEYAQTNINGYLCEPSKI